MMVSSSTSLSEQRICFIGAGNMARGLVGGLVGSINMQHVIVCAPEVPHLDAMKKDFGAQAIDNNVAGVKDATIVLFAVKPQVADEVLSQLKAALPADVLNGKLYISVMAGVRARHIADALSLPTLRVVRTMPNTPALVRRGVTGLWACPRCTDCDKAMAETIFEKVGITHWLKKEDDINDLTAFTGSSPAYFFEFCRAMQVEAERRGFEASVARKLVLEAAAGSIALALSQPDVSLEQLRTNVTSPGGTTAEALRVFSEAKLADTVSRAIEAAVKRSIELGGGPASS